jgi:hypothetical protein
LDAAEVGFDDERENRDQQESEQAEKRNRDEAEIVDGERVAGVGRGAETRGGDREFLEEVVVDLEGDSQRDERSDEIDGGIVFFDSGDCGDEEERVHQNSGVPSERAGLDPLE